MEGKKNYTILLDVGDHGNDHVINEIKIRHFGRILIVIRENCIPDTSTLVKTWEFSAH